MKIYISGPMTGIKDFNYPTFEEAARHLRALGHEVISPNEITPEIDKTYHEYMRRDLAAVCECDAIVLLDGWEKSRGCADEIYVAKACGLQFRKYHNGDLLEIDLNAGRKFDGDKLQWDKMLWPELTDVMKVIQFGAQKYDWNNFAKVPNGKERYTAAMYRHLIAYNGGEKNDQETGLPHLAHAICCALFLMHIDK